MSRPRPRRRWPLLLFVLAAASLPVLYGPSGPPGVYSLLPAAAGLTIPDCESGRLLTLRDPPMRGDDVAELQTALGGLGLYDGTVDGVFGPQTARAVSTLRSKHGLDPSPRADTAFWRALADEWWAAHPASDLPVAAAMTEPPEGELLLVINIETLRLTVYAGGFPHKTYPVAAGKPSTPSAVGQWRVVNKGINVGPPFGTRWMGLSVPWGIYGVHGTNNPGSIGTHASGGCIRMFNHHVEELYEWVSVGTPVHIISPHWPAVVYPSLPPGAVGLSVVFLQWQMQRLGWYRGSADGRLGEATVSAVRSLEAFYGLPVDGLADHDVLCLLDLDR